MSRTEELIRGIEYIEKTLCNGTPLDFEKNTISNLRDTNEKVNIVIDYIQKLLKRE